jgi:hypothetical protein
LPTNKAAMQLLFKYLVNVIDQIIKQEISVAASNILNSEEMAM